MTNDLKLAKWTPGVIDEPWKRRVVFGNRDLAIDTVNGLGYILFGSTYPGVPATDFAGQCDVIATMSGAEIAEQLRRFGRVTAAELEASKDISTCEPQTPSTD